MISFQPGRTHSIPWDSSFLAQRLALFEEDPAVSYRHGFAAASASFLPVVRSLQAEIESLERERDALLRGPSSLPDHFVIPLPPAIEVRGRITEVKEAVFLFFDDND